MAITILKQPALFFNCTNPAIFEFTTDASIGNFDDYVCDVFVKSLYTNKTAVIRNVFPNTITKIFSLNIADFLKSLQLKDFDFIFSETKNLAIEKFNLEFNIRDNNLPSPEVFSYNDYYFDNFVFTIGTSSVDTDTSEPFYSILGEKTLIDKANTLVANTNDFLTPETIEVCNGFKTSVSVWQNEAVTPDFLLVDIYQESIPQPKGVGTVFLSDDQTASINSLTPIYLKNNNKKIYAYPFNRDCVDIIQFRFYNSKGGFSYFYAVAKSSNETRSKVTFYENDYFNENENNSAQVQSSSEFSNKLEFSGIKIIELKPLFSDLLRSPKIEMNLKQLNGNDYFIETEVTGTSADQYTHFDFKLSATIKNTGNFKL